MNAGEFRERVDILELTETEKGLYVWQTAARMWAKADHPATRNIFSKHGLSAQSVKFTVHRHREITLHNALAFVSSSGEHCFLTNISAEKPGFLTLTAAYVTPVPCLVTRPTPQTDKYKRRVFDEPQEKTLRFPAVLSEKYLGFEQLEPMARTTTTLLLVTPKLVALEVGDLVRIGYDPVTLEGGDVYAVQLCHLLDGYKNEYEITRKEDA